MVVLRLHLKTKILNLLLQLSSSVAQMQNAVGKRFSGHNYKFTTLSKSCEKRAQRPVSPPEKIFNAFTLYTKKRVSKTSFEMGNVLKLKAR